MNKMTTGEKNIYFELKETEADNCDDVAGESATLVAEQTSREKCMQGAEKKRQASTEHEVAFCQSDMVSLRRMLFVVAAVAAVALLIAIATLILALTAMKPRNDSTAKVQDFASTGAMKSEDYNIIEKISENVTTLIKKMGEKGERGDPGTSCKCNLQDPNKPSAHLEAANKRDVTYQANNVIKDWNVSAPNSHLAGGMTYQDGNLTVPTPGRYYIYAQLYYHSSGRVFVNVNNNHITMIQLPTLAKDHGILYAGGVFNLKAGDVITLKATNYPSATKIYMWSVHCYFGAYLI